ncbi:LacI family DNA-binding transcriptional regulator [Pseudoalteromonas sp. McH1-7]|uniref:LacI family DNA-binding transcriptional regulator n=2 Tax=Pseudoalteromonas TaxID=53246 RepID=UPI000FFF143F|nr:MULTISPECIES: LacI family DNA-binding transcriptional regulator [unclassified Pseudoalteromonas]NUZ09890.1 LacI family DNA-binding transcriptional regulator [Pseudoalteromonas sp. McH1-7]RXF01568.1 LacI family DNA-binding transcriptional regulator [Pseudoalteromonas sp. PS5]
MKNDKKRANVTIFDVAKEAQVSKSTVSLVLTQSEKVSDKSKAKVLHAIEKLGYVYNREAAALRSKRTNLVALVMNDLTCPLCAQLAVELEKQVYTLGMVPMLVSTNECIERQQQAVQAFKEYNVSAFIMIPAKGTSRQWLDNLYDSGFLVITIMREIAFAKAPSILPDNKKGTHLATSHLIEVGARHIAALGEQDCFEYQAKLAGFQSALTSHHVKHQATVIDVQNNRRAGKKAFKQLIETHRNIDAVMCFSDFIAYGVVDTMREIGLSPGRDIKVIGFNDFADSQFMTPSLSSVKIDINEICRRTCQTLSEQLSGTTPAATTIVDVTLQLRDSSQICEIGV